jgi:16S rRNA (guanine527-N7)-methyltransferase
MSDFGLEQFAQKTSVSRETLDKLKIYAELLDKWQRRMNLVSNTTIEDMWQRHFYDSAQLMDYIEFAKTGSRLKFLDIGSGAGFPGLVLSILGAGEFHMIESNGKKSAFMNQVIRDTGIDAVVYNERVEEMESFPVDYVTSRACASLSKLFELGKNFITEETICLFLKGEIAQQEITEAEKKWHFETEKYTSKTESVGSILRLSKIRALS